MSLVKHSAREYVRGGVHTNGVESFWSMFERAYRGTYRQISPQHLQRYVNEMAGCYNIRDLDAIKQMKSIAAGMTGKRLRYRDLVGDGGS